MQQVEQERKNKLGHRKVNRSDRTPSFYTSRSIVNLSGLSVADPVPMPLSARQQQSPTSQSTGSKPSSFTITSARSASVANVTPGAAAGASSSSSNAAAPTFPTSSPSGGIRKLFGSFKELESAGASESNTSSAAPQQSQVTSPPQQQEWEMVPPPNVQPRQRLASIDFQIGSAVSLDFADTEDMERIDEGDTSSSDEAYGEINNNEPIFTQVQNRSTSFDGGSERRPSQNDTHEGQQSARITK